MSTWRRSPLPKEVVINQSAVPVFTSVGGPTMLFASGLTDLEEISITNTTSAAIAITVTDGNDVQIANLSAYSIGTNTPYDLQFLTPVRCVSGVKIYANSIGLKVTVHGWRNPGFTDRSA